MYCCPMHPLIIVTILRLLLTFMDLYCNSLILVDHAWSYSLNKFLPFVLSCSLINFIVCYIMRLSDRI